MGEASILMFDFTSSENKWKKEMWS